jgi:hypothetical protein
MKRKTILVAFSLVIFILFAVNSIVILQGTSLKEVLKVKQVSAAEGTYQKIHTNCSCSYTPPNGCGGEPMYATCDGPGGNLCDGVMYYAWPCKWIFASPCPGPGGITQHECVSEN